MEYKIEITAVFTAQGEKKQIEYTETILRPWLEWLAQYITPKMDFEMVTSVVEVKDGAENDQNLPESK